MTKSKIILYTIIVLSLVITGACRQMSGNSGGANEGTANGTADITFSSFEHDFGQISEGEKVACLFSFSNKGTGSLVIESATTSCGCTVPEFEKEPIPPGGSGTLEVVFDSSGRSGMQTKTITVRSNASQEVVILKITAEVIPNNN